MSGALTITSWSSVAFRVRDMVSGMLSALKVMLSYPIARMVTDAVPGRSVRENLPDASVRPNERILPSLPILCTIAPATGMPSSASVTVECASAGTAAIEASSPGRRHRMKKQYLRQVISGLSSRVLYSRMVCRSRQRHRAQDFRPHPTPRLYHLPMTRNSRMD